MQIKAMPSFKHSHDPNSTFKSTSIAQSISLLHRVKVTFIFNSIRFTSQV